MKFKRFFNHIFNPPFIFGSSVVGGTGFLWYKHIIDDQVACTLLVVSVPFVIGGNKTGTEIGREVKRNLILIHLLRLLLKEFK